MSVEQRRYSEDGRRRYVVRWRERGLGRQRAFDRHADARDFDNAMKRLNRLARQLGVNGSTIGGPPAGAPPELAHRFRSLQKEVQERELAAPYGPKQGPPTPPLLPSVPEHEASGTDDLEDHLALEHRKALFAAVQIMDDELLEAMERRRDELRHEAGSAPDSYWCSHAPVCQASPPSRRCTSTHDSSAGTTSCSFRRRGGSQNPVRRIGLVLPQRHSLSKG